MPPPDPTLPPIEQLREVVAKLRGPGGCPWDREQTHATLRGGLLEEAYEVVAAIDAGDDANLREELGDLLLQVIFHSQLAAEEGRFGFDEVAREIAEKLVRRHPHVFGAESAETSAAVLVKWDEIKRAEKGGAAAAASLLDGLPAGLPGAAARAQGAEESREGRLRLARCAADPGEGARRNRGAGGGDRRRRRGGGRRRVGRSAFLGREPRAASARGGRGGAQRLDRRNSPRAFARWKRWPAREDWSSRR